MRSPLHETPQGMVGAIVVAAGASRRMAGADKVFAPVMGRPLVAHSLQVLVESPQIGQIALVVSSENMEQGKRMVREYGWDRVIRVCPGGLRRQDSVCSGIKDMPHAGWIIVHDGARPCLDGDMIARGLGAARESGAAVAAVAVKDTIKEAGPDGVVQHTLSRDRLWAVQTPQVFSARMLREAHRRVVEDVTDDASMVEQVGGTVHIFPGSYDNLKVTTAEDLSFVEATLEKRRAAAIRARG